LLRGFQENPVPPLVTNEQSDLNSHAGSKLLKVYDQVLRVKREKKSEPMNRNLRVLKKGQRILLVGRKISGLRVDEGCPIQAISSQPKKKRRPASSLALTGT
jgi:hypothetical protein